MLPGSLPSRASARAARKLSFAQWSRAWDLAILESASVVPTLLDPLEVHGGALVAGPNLGGYSGNGVPGSVHA